MKFSYNNVFFIKRRFIFLCILIFVLFLGLIGRIVYLQLINSKMLLHEGDMRSLRMQQLSTVRGTIRDRAGRLLAISVPVYSVCLDPQELIKSKYFDFFLDERWKILSDILSIPLNQISSYVRFRFNDRFVYLARQISTSVGEYIFDLKLPGIFLRSELRRYYPCSQITAHVVGVTDIDGHGIEGVEKSFDFLLSGRSGFRTVRKDRFGRVIEDISSIQGHESNNLFLSIDERLQTLIYHELNRAVILNKAESGSSVLIDVDTGEVLAMVNIPSYDPNNLSIAIKKFIRNRAISDLFEPGSTIKPIVIMAALHQGIIQTNTILDTLPYFINGHQIKDVVHYNKLSIKEILRKSSNVGVSKLALKIPQSCLIDTYLKFGFGKKTNLGLVGESYNLSFCKNYYSDIERATLSYGYGIMVTPLQLAKAYAIIGGMGVSRPLSIIRKDTKVLGEQIFPASLVRAVVNMMDSRLLFSENIKEINKEYRIAIKTGTVKKVGKCGKYIKNYISYAAGIAPISNPRYSLVVMINEPQSGQYYGGVVSVPVCINIMKGVIRIMHM